MTKDTHKHHDAPQAVKSAPDETVGQAAGPERRQDDRRRDDRRKGDRRTNPWPGCEEAADLEMTRLKGEIDSLKDTMMRRQADFENYKKRIIKQQADQKKMAIRDIALDIICVNDDLLRALDASENLSNGESLDQAHRSFVAGVSMTSKRIEECLAQYGVTEIAAMGQAFDPQLHEAVEIEARADVSTDTVTMVYQKGFRIEDLVVRSARVRVAKPQREPAPATPPGTAEPGDDAAAQA